MLRLTNEMVLPKLATSDLFTETLLLEFRRRPTAKAWSTRRIFGSSRSVPGFYEALLSTSTSTPCTANRIPGPITMIKDVRAFGRFPPDYPFEQFAFPRGEVRDIARTSKFSQAFES